MANNNLNIISSSKYDIYSKLLDIAASHDYIATNTELSNIDFLRTGLFGYVTESLAMILRDSAFHNTMVYRENFLNTAIMPTSIYNWAKMFNINCINASPSLRYATILIDVNAIDQVIQNTTASVSDYRTKYGINEAGNFMVLDKTNPIVAGNYYFNLEHSIEIYKNKNGKYIVKYCLNEQNKTTGFGTYSDGGIINTTYEITNSSKYLSFKVLVAQYKTVETSKIITGSTYLDTRVHKFEFEGQICGMSLSYTKGNTTEDVELKFSNIDLQEDKESETKVAYYSLVDENNIEISFLSNSIAGLPQTGGQLTLKMFITEGYNGNISYNGDSVFLIKQDDFKSIPISVVLSSDIYSSGVDQASISDIKENIINELSTRDVIITENDLNIWFGTQSKLLEDIGNSKITFRKEKDNILRRTFTAYLLLRDGASLDEYLNLSAESNETNSIVSSSYISNVVPTNTIDITVSPTGDNSDTILIDTTDRIYYDIPTQTYILSSSAANDTDYIYRTPFNIILNTTYNQVSYMYLETNNSSELEFTDVEKMDDMTIIPTQVVVKHENKTDENNSTDDYILTFNVSSDTDLTAKTIESLEIYFDNMKFIIPTNAFVFKLIDSDDESTTSGLSNYSLEIPAAYKQTITTSEATIIELELAGNNIVQLTETSKISLKLAFTGFEGTMSSIDSLTYFTQLDDIISSNLLINYDADGKIVNYIIKDVPVVADYWIKSKINKSWFIRQLFVFINMLKTNINKLETTTFFNIKFRNTYGFSHYYNSVNTQLRLGLTIYINRDKAASIAAQLNTTDDEYTSLKNEIRDYIRVLVDKANESGELVISKIIMQTQAQYYNYITHIDFNGLNNTYNQYIKQINTNDISYPLEYFSLDETLDSNNKCRLEQDINFVFE